MLRDDEPYLKSLADKIGVGKHFSVGQTHRAVYPKRHAAWVVADKLTAIMQRLVSVMESPVAMVSVSPVSP